MVKKYAEVFFQLANTLISAGAKYRSDYVPRRVFNERPFYTKHIYFR